MYYSYTPRTNYEHTSHLTCTTELYDAMHQNVIKSHFNPIPFQFKFKVILSPQSVNGLQAVIREISIWAG